MPAPKLLFGGLTPRTLQSLQIYLMLEQYDPWMIKHIQRTPVFCPVESQRESSTYSFAEALGNSITANYSEADSISHSVEHSFTHGRSRAKSLAVSEGEQESYTCGANSSITDSDNWGDRTFGQRCAYHRHRSRHGRTRGSGISDGTTDSKSANVSSGWSEGERQYGLFRPLRCCWQIANFRNKRTSSSEGQVMLPQEERAFPFLQVQEEPVVLTTSNKHWLRRRAQLVCWHQSNGRVVVRTR